MMTGGERKPHVERRPGNIVSSAFWPMKVRKGIATGKAAQRRRDWIMQGRWWVILVDALSMRVLLVLTTLLVVTTSLLVAALGLSFWYLLLLPLLLFAVLLIVPLFLASRMPVEAVPSSSFAQEWKSSTGFLSQYAQELRSSGGVLSQYAQELRSEPGLLSVEADAPATPMPAAPPLVRVLETYDLRQTLVKHFLEDLPDDTARQAAARSLAGNIWGDVDPRSLPHSNLPCSQVGAGSDVSELHTSRAGEAVESLAERELSPDLETQGDSQEI